ncbi:TrmB family transcriptional regulator [Streptomyces sp. NPDC001594]|uniref:TrmB family transcriptional regulator n=1 Tax=Streptomyces sp. NPDC001594 TaxID=3364590 RepID=UPI0036CB3F80
MSQTYARILRREHIESGDPGLAPLLDRDLVRPDAYAPGQYNPAVPHQAERAAVRQVREELERMLGRLAEIPAISEALEPAFEASRFYGGPASEFLETPDGMNARITEVIEAAETELLTAQPGLRPRTVLQRAVERDRRALERGVVMHTLYHPSSRSNPAVREYADQVVPLGGQIRTLASEFQRLIIVDGRHAFVSNLVVEDAPPHCGWHVTDRAAVAILREAFSLEWARAEAWERTGAPDAETITTDVQRGILRLLESGLDVKQVPGRLGMSDTAVAKQLRLLKAATGTTTLFGLGAWWATATAERALD